MTGIHNFKSDNNQRKTRIKGFFHLQSDDKNKRELFMYFNFVKSPFSNKTTQYPK